MLYTSLNQIKSFNPCAGGWRAINKLTGIESSDQLFELTRCLETNNISDVLWLLGKLKKKEICVQFAQWCANSVKHLRNASDTAYAAYSAANAYAANAAAAATAYSAANAATYSAFIAKQKIELIRLISEAV